jgi:hypothetical protein
VPISVGPDADWRAKVLIDQVMEGPILDAYLQLSVQKPTSHRTFLQPWPHHSVCRYKQAMSYRP